MSAHRLLVCCLTMASAIAPAEGQDPQNPNRVGTSAFSIEPPAGKGWTLSVRSDSLGLQFVHAKHGIPGMPGISKPEEITISVIVDSTTDENAARGEQAVAQDFIDQEEAGLRAETRRSFSEDVTLRKVERRVDSTGVYRLYVFEASMRVATWSAAGQNDQQLDLYFPPDFGTRGQFFAFHMSRIRPGKNGWDENAFKVLRQVIASFRDQRSRAGAK